MSPAYLKEWVKKAEADRLAARRALQDAKRRKDQAEIACFHAQQCAEKYLKAILTFRDKPVPRTHDLLALAGMIEDCGIPFAEIESGLRELNRYAVEIRYPGETATVKNAAKAVLHMEKAVAFAIEVLKTRSKNHRNSR